ncbi:mucin-5AC-like [Terrapene carolina triunguis]|uniref:mucin-5AC-like n=1 Tax=Terrapene triunguis TaxID=2587831 RepID=UPI001156683F|nr:mucin-5AC-like [Terrapene carolina triunguis]
MGFGQGIRVSVWAFMLGVCCAQKQAFITNTPSGTVNFIPPLTTSPVITSFNPAHNGRVCSTWGNFHFKTFDGDIFYFPGLCNYVFASHCNAAYEDFNIQIRRTVVENAPTINHITMKLDGVVFEMAKNFVVVNGNRVQLPYSQSGIMVGRSSMYIKVTAKMGLVFMWNEDDSILVRINSRSMAYANQDDICRKVLTGPAFSECNALVEVSEYIKSCEQDLCRCDQSKNAFCICNTFGEYSRQCAHAGGQPLNWRTPQLCPKKCPFNMQYQECGSPCTDTCTNPERSPVCDHHSMDGCFCPPGTVLDDINNAGCIPLWKCSCTYNGNSYAPGTSFHAHCHSCTCNGGQWICTDIPCPGSCTVEGGSHISTYDEKRYNVHGDCTYVLSKHCKDDTFAVLGELRPCGLTDTETCLKKIVLSINGGQTIIVFKPGGGVFVNWIYTQLPFSAANVTIFRPSSFFIMVETNFGLQLEIQLVPIMQAFVRLDPSFKGQTCGLCGNFNSIQTDDFKAISGVVEGTTAAFVNTWKTQASCPNIENNFENPCALSVENEKYAQHWCGLLTDSTGPFANCHLTVDPAVYHTNCLFDTCNCEKSEDCMCAALSSYVRACAAKGVQLEGWRTDVCSKYTTSCPKSLSYSYNISSCQPTCRSLSEPDVTCNIRFIPVDGCTCEKGTYMDEYGKCVSASECPCYYKGSPILSGEVVHEDGLVCTCARGKLSCIGAVNQSPVCAPPMVYFDCSNVTAGTTGAECQKSCQTLDMQCYSTQCMSGCMCPSGLVSNGKGSCVAEEECPCIHNEATYKPGEEIKVDCNTCVCKNRMWKCTSEQCLGTCAIYGDGHYITFDDKRFNFNGDCEYTLVQDYCGKNSTVNGTFRVVTENIPCGSTGTTCSKSIKVFLVGYELILSEEHLEVIERENGRQMPYQVRYMGMYLVIETNNGLILMWDKKTSIFMKLSPDFKGQVCGLCGNYDGNGINDFTTRSQSVVGDVLEFGNSWKVSLTCPDANSTKDPCSTNPYRKSWSQRQCSIINSEVFAACHSQVEPTKYYEACVTDACACDSGGDCECFCTAVAAYAQACSEFGVCVAWRTPSICPLFCDYYNPEGKCEWHYKPCGAPCMKTCRNPSGRCLHKLPGLEGCYPNCPANKPYFNEDEMTCVDNCGCYDAKGNYHKPGVSFYSQDNCQSCTCTMEGLECKFDAEACYCYYEEHKYKYKDVIYNTTDGIGGCLSAICDINGTITRKFFECSGITTTIPFTFSTVLPPSAAGTTTTPPVTTVCVHNVCQWSEWYDVSYPRDPNYGDFETFEKIRAKGFSVCETPSDVECRAERYTDVPLKDLNQKVTCSKDFGLICSTLPPSGQTTTEGTTLLSTQPTSQGSTTTLLPPVSTTVSITSTASPPTPGTATGSAGTAPLQTGTIPPPTGTRPQPSPGSTLPSSGQTTTQGTTLLSTQPTSQASTTTLVPPISTTVSVSSTASPPTPGKATGLAPTVPLQTGTIPPVTGTRPQPSPGSTLPPSGRTTTEGTTLLSTQPTPQGSTTTLVPPVSTTVSVSSTASPPTPSIPTGSAGTASLQTGTIPPVTGTRGEMRTGSASTGEVIYNRTDSTGCSFYALCSKRCEIERLQGPCPTTTPVSVIPSSTIPSLSTPTAISSSVPVTPETTPISGCPDADPPRKMNESWMLNNCTMATCEGDNRIVLLLPPAVEMITCASGLPPIKVYDEDGCNYHYECDCVCSGWSNSDYLTFDGTHYTFHDNCTYVLMKQIVPKYNFRILVDNYFCDVADGLSCPRSIIVNYNSMEIVLISQIHQGEKNNKILVNNEPISGGFSRDGISVANDGTYMVVEIPDIKSYIFFNGLTFTVKMPFSMFGHNTEGQCGTCSNDKVDECRMPSGEVISSCSEMAAAWQVQNENKPNCERPPVPPATPTTPPVPCNSTSPLCELILSDLFAECHKILTPSIFYESCIADSCHITNESIPCFSLKTYASLCSAKGVCADWRSKTQGQCPYNCPNGKVYDACGPLNPVACHSGTVNHTSEHVAEGCFCPKDKILFNSYTDICVSECGCNTSACSQTKKTCEPGYQLATILSEGGCCVNYTCEPIPDVCVLNGTIYQPGMSVPMDSCKTCICSSEVDPVSNRNLLQCEVVRCDTTCPLGYEYMMKDGECCGECVQVACTIKLTNNTVQVLKPGDIWKPEDNPCSYYKCEKIEDQLVSVTVLRTCPAFDPEDCKPNEVQLTPDGCCKTCTSGLTRCKVYKNSTVIRHNECESSEPIELTYCEGVCASSSVYSFETQQMQHKCTCCQELKSHKREVTLTCSNGTSMNYDYVYVEECQCMTECIPETTTTQQFQKEEEQKKTR